MRAPGVHPSGQGRQWYGLYPHDWNGAEVEVNKLLVTLNKFDTDQIPLRLVGSEMCIRDRNNSMSCTLRGNRDKFMIDSIFHVYILK